MDRTKRISPVWAVARLLLLLLVIVTPLGTSGLGLSSAVASDEAALDATPVEPESPPAEDTPTEEAVEPTAEPTDPVPTETATLPPVEITPAGSSAAGTPPAPEGSPEMTDGTTPDPANMLMCDKLENATILPGETYDLPCTYMVNTPDHPVDVVAAFAAVPGSGWLVTVVPAEEASGGSPAAERAEWAPEAGLATGSSRELTVRVFAPDDAVSGQTATVQIGLDGDAASTASVELTVDAGDFNVASVETVEGVKCSTYSSPRPLGWNQVIVYACTLDPGVATFGTNSFIRYSFDDGADETASWGLGPVILNPANLPGPRYPGTSLPGTTIGGFASPLAVYIPIWTPISANDATDAAGTISLYAGCTPELQCSDGYKIFSARFKVTIGESSNQNGDASLTCVPTAGGVAYPVSYTVQADVTCTVEALVDNLELRSFSVSPPQGWRGSLSGDGGSLPKSLAKGATYQMRLLLTPSECGITAASIPITIGASVQRGGDPPKSLAFTTQLTASPSDVLRPASVSLDFSSLNFGTGSWNQIAGGSWNSTFRVLPPSCLPTGTTQQVSLSIAGNGNSFRSTSGGTLALSQLTLASLYSDSPYPDAAAAPILLPTDLTSSPAIVSITAAGNTPRVFWIALTLLAPAGTPPGTYSATITLEITGGDD